MNMIRSCIAGLAVLVSALPALAGQDLEVEIDKSRALVLPKQPGAIVIGNPSIADVTVHGDKIFIHGRNFGETNLMVLDLDGKPFMEYNLVTRNLKDTSLTLFKGSSFSSPRRLSMVCFPMCEGDIQVGDDLLYFKSLIEAAKEKTKFATGSDTAEAQAPPAPQ
jgi:hypothetical protein